MVFREREFGIIFNKEAEWRGSTQVEPRNLVESRNLIYTREQLNWRTVQFSVPNIRVAFLIKVDKNGDKKV